MYKRQIQHYTEADKQGRRYIAGKDGEKRYFPVRKPLSLTFAVDEADAADRYARRYSSAVVDEINQLHVPRYGLGLYVDLQAEKTATGTEPVSYTHLDVYKRQVEGLH